ncbi:MAG: glutamine-hydrolyzing GMP synthase [Chloroflexota bacterium]
MDSIAILDFGSQYAQLIARRLRETHVYCELFPWDAPAAGVMALRPKGFILSGGPRSVYEPGAPFIPNYVLESHQPILGICYGMQALTHALGGQVDPSAQREYGPASIEPLMESALSNLSQVWMSHGDRITRMPEGFTAMARSAHSPLAAIGDMQRKYFGLQFHPEVRHTPNGDQLLSHFAVQICGARPEWTPRSIIDEAVGRVRQQVGDERVLAAVSGGIDSTVAAALAHKAVGDQLVTVFVDTGLLRKGESEQVTTALRYMLHAETIAVDAGREFLEALHGVLEPEQKRRIIGEKFIRLFEEQARQLGNPRFLVQGTIYPDVVESSAPERSKVDRIKTHHNVGGLPEHMDLELVEPLRYLFKDEVRLVGEELGLPEFMIWRQPFPGPGLAVRCLGEITFERLERLRAADAIFQEELAHAGLIGKHAAFSSEARELAVSQGFVVLLPVRSVGVMGDQRTYQETAALRAVTTEDFMTADWARLPHDLLARVANRIVNEVDGINRVVYDITSKPPATIEWE